MSTKPVRAYGPALLSGSAATKYTVPQDQLFVLRNICFSNPSGSAVTLTISIGADAAGTRIRDAFSVAAGAVYDVGCYYPVASQEIIQALAGTANVAVLTLSGDLYFI